MTRTHMKWIPLVILILVLVTLFLNLRNQGEQPTYSGTFVNLTKYELGAMPWTFTSSLANERGLQG